MYSSATCNTSTQMFVPRSSAKLLSRDPDLYRHSLVFQIDVLVLFRTSGPWTEHILQCIIIVIS